MVAVNLPIDGLSEEQLKYLPVFSSLLTQVGAGDRNYLEMAQKMEAVTGGISARTSLLDDPQSLDRYIASFELKGKALLRNRDELLALLKDFALSPDFSDLQRIHTVLNQLKVSLENSVPQSGHTYAARTAAACLSPTAQLREQWSGLSQVALVRQLADQPQEQLGELARIMEEIARQLFRRDRLQVAVTVEAKNFGEFENSLGGLLTALPKAAEQVAEQESAFSVDPQRQGWVWSIPVNYVTRVFRAVPYTHPDAAALTVLAKLLRAEFLHREIREKGGAYGGLASYNSEAGIFSMLSYRDPHILRTLEVYEQAIDWAAAGEFAAETVKEAILAVFSDLDKPLSPAGAGAQEFANLRQGMSLEMRNQMRQQLLKVDVAALQKVATTYLKQGTSAVSVLAGEAALQQANEQLGEQALVLRKL